MSLKGADVQDHQWAGLRRRFCFAWKEEPPVDSIVNRPGFDSEHAAHRLSYIPGVRKDCVRLPNGAGRVLRCRFIDGGHHVRDHGGFQPQPAPQREEEVIQGAESRVEINVRPCQQQTGQEARRVSVRAGSN